LSAGSGKAPQAVAERESAAFEMVEEELEVVEEDEDDDESDDGKDALVDHLFEQLKELKTRVSIECHFMFIDS
jgi:kinesin family protein 20